MPKLLLCLMLGFAIAGAALELRQQEMELRHRMVTLQRDIEHLRGRLWNQQLRIAIETSPGSLSKMLGQGQVQLVPEVKGKAGNG